MSWRNASWKFRIPVSVNFSAGAGTNDVEFTIPASLDIFWDNVASDGKDIRVTTADGYTDLPYKLSSWTYASRVGVVQVDNAVATLAGQLCLWLYWGNSSATDAQAVFSASSPKTGKIENYQPAGKIAVIQSERAGGARSLNAMSIDSEDIREFFLDVRALLRQWCTTVSGLYQGEEIAEIDVDVVATDDSVVGSAADPAAARFIGCSRGRGGIVSVMVNAASGPLVDGSNYALKVKVYTSNGSTWIARVALYCRDVRPS